MQADILTKIILPASLFLIMFGLGLTLRLTNFADVLKFPKAFLVGITAQLLMLPAIALVLAIAFQLPGELAVGLMIIALAPGGVTSNLFTFLYKGDVSLSISLTAFISLITPFTIPFFVALSMQFFMESSSEFSLPIVKTILQLLVITIIPVTLGMLLLAKLPSVAKRIHPSVKALSLSFMVFIIILIIIKNADQMMSFFAQTGLVTLLLNFATLLMAYQMGKWAKLKMDQRITVGFEVGIQNGTLALLVAGTLIGNSIMMIPAVTYSLLMFATGFLFGTWLSKRQ